MHEHRTPIAASGVGLLWRGALRVLLVLVVRSTGSLCIYYTIKRERYILYVVMYPVIPLPLTDGPDLTYIVYSHCTSVPVLNFAIFVERNNRQRIQCLEFSSFLMIEKVT